MIIESCYWKDPLLKSALRFREFSRTKKPEESDLVQIELDVFLGFYSIRKLMDTIKISDKTKQFQLSLEWYPNIEKVNIMNIHHPDKLYDFNTKNKMVKDLRFICNQIIHSYIFFICVSENGYFGGIFCSSDTYKNSKLFFITLASLIEIFETVGNDYPNHMSMIRDAETGQCNAHTW